MKRVYVDMDGVLCDFELAVIKGKHRAVNSTEEKYPQSRQGFFTVLDPIPGAIAAVNELKEKFDVWILTRPSFPNVHCYTEKAIWVRMHLGYEMQKKLILCGDKSLVKGDYLIDDKTTDGQDRFEGKLIQFGSKEFPNWITILNYLLKNEHN